MNCNMPARLTVRCTGAVIWSLSKSCEPWECGDCWRVRTGYQKGDLLPLDVTEVQYIEPDGPYFLG